jgi:integrase
MLRQSPPRRFRFTNAFIARLEVPPGKNELVLFETGTGLGVKVSKSGHIGFLVQLRLKDGSRWRETLGAYGKLTIESAREAVQALAGEIAKGIDPRQKRIEREAEAKARAQAEGAERFTLGVLVERWRREHLSSTRPGYAGRAVRNVERAFASLFDTPASALTRAGVRKAIESVQGPSATRSAVMSLRAACRWALEQEYLDRDPLDGLKLPGRASSRSRVLAIDEARRIYSAAGKLDYPAGRFVQLLMLTGARRMEIAALRWDEITTEMNGPAIELPPQRTKMGVGHHIPLSPQALAVIDDARAYRIAGSPYVLTSDGWRNFNNFDRVKALLDAVLEQNGDVIPHWVFHDFRRTIVSTLARKPFRYDPTMLDLLLGHQPSTLSAVGRIYQREQRLDDRREALETWAKHLTQASNG